jgi:hypothetical protein
MKIKIFTIVALFVLAACNDILEEDPKAIASETFYNTADEVAAATNAIYSPLRSEGALGGTYPSLMECMPDYGYGRGSWADNSNYAGLNATNISRIGTTWTQFYLTIRNANLVIKNTPNGASTTESEKAQFIGEAKFLRAFTYFLLVRSWGGVPLRKEETMENIEIARNSADQVYELILSDLQYAVENLPDEPRLIGAPSKWVAKTLLADVYLNLQNWTSARDLTDEVIRSGKFSLVKVNTPDDFNNIYGPDVVNTSEEVFYIKFHDNSGSFFMNMAHHPSSGYNGNGGWYGHYTTTDNLVYKNWDNNDFRKQNGFYSFNIGLGSNTLLYKKYIDPEATGYPSNDLPYYRYADVLMMYAEAANNAGNGPTSKAVECLNEVHRRAYGLDPEMASSIDFKIEHYTKESFLDLIIQERGYETFYEGKRWLELVRMGKAVEIIKEVKGKDIAEKHYLFPIPVAETNYNKAINPETDQNPGY